MPKIIASYESDRSNADYFFALGKNTASERVIFSESKTFIDSAKEVYNSAIAVNVDLGVSGIVNFSEI